MVVILFRSYAHLELLQFLLPQNIIVSSFVYRLKWTNHQFNNLVAYVQVLDFDFVEMFNS